MDLKQAVSDINLKVASGQNAQEDWCFNTIEGCSDEVK
jgi:hypothetical protein